MALIHHSSLGFARQRSTEASAAAPGRDHSGRDSRRDAGKDVVKDKKDR